MFCRFCGSNLPDDSVFCHSCGKSIATKATPVNTSPSSIVGPPFAQPTRGKQRAIVIVTGVIVAAVLVSLITILWLRSSRGNSQANGQSNTDKVTLKTKEKPSFDCSKAKTATDNAICADEDLTSLEVSMVAAYRQALDRLPPAERSDFRRQHLEWFKDYQGSCNAAAQAGKSADLKACISKALSEHARALQAANVNTLPQLVGQCTTTTVSKIGTRLTEGVDGPDIPGSGSLISYADGGSQVSYDTIPGIEQSHVGDKILLCLVSIPKSCPPGDDRGKWYTAKNLRTNATWRLPDSQHDCGGA